MKKTLIALAALVATGAFAQSTVSITGLLDAGIKGTSAPASSATSSKSNTSVAQNNTATTAIVFSGSEDMGGGLKANFLLEMNPNIVQSTTLNSDQAKNAEFFAGTPFTGQQFVGLESNMGTVKLGVVNSGALSATGMSGPFGTAMGGGYSTFGRLGVNTGGVSSALNNTATASRIIRHEKTINYTTPNFNGFTAMAEYAFGNDNSTAADAANSDTFLGATLQYSKGPLNVIYNYSNVRFGANPAFMATAAMGVTTTTTGTTNVFTGATTANTALVNSDIAYHIAAANYTFGAATVYAGYTSTKHNANSTGAVVEDGSSWNIAGKYAVSAAVDLMGNYLVRTTNLAAFNNAKVIGLGADYKLSKRTNLYARYELVDTNTDSKAAASTAASVTNAYAFGVKHTF